MQLSEPKKIQEEQRTFLDHLIEEASGFLPENLNYSAELEVQTKRTAHFFFLTKYLRTFKALCLLIDQNYGEDAAILQRSLFEIWVKAVHFQNFPKESAFLYRIQYHRKFLKSISNFEKVSGQVIDESMNKEQIINESQQFINNQIERLRKFAPELAAKVEKDPRNLWPGKTLYDFLIDLKIEREWYYIVYYAIPSGLLHTSFDEVMHYAEQNESRVVPRIEPFGTHVFEAAYSAAGLLIQLLDLVNRVYQLEKKESVQKLNSRFNVLFNDDRN